MNKIIISAIVLFIICGSAEAQLTRFKVDTVKATKGIKIKNVDRTLFFDRLSSENQTTTNAVGDSTISLQKLTQAAYDWIGSGGNVTNNPDDISIETKGGSTLGIKDSYFMAADTNSLKTFSGTRIYLAELSIGSGLGPGDYVMKDSTYSEIYKGGAFNHPTNGKQWVLESLSSTNVVNILHFGADPTASTVSTEAFINAHKFAGLIGAEVLWPSGDYRISCGRGDGKFWLSGAMNINGQRWIRTLTRERTVLYPAADNDTVLAMSRTGEEWQGVSSQGIKIQNIEINGVYGTDSAKVGIFIPESNDSYFGNIMIKDVSRSDTAYGIIIDGPNSVRFEHVVTTRCDYGVSMTETDGIYFHNCRFLRPKIANIYMNDCLSTTFMDTDFESNWAAVSDTANRADKKPFRDVTVKMLIFKHSRENNFYNCYCELGGDSLENIISYEMYDDVGLGWVSTANLYGGRWLYGGADYGFKLQTQQISFLNIFGGEHAYGLNTEIPVAAKDTTTVVVGIFGPNMNPSNVAAGAKTVYVAHYDSSMDIDTPDGVDEPDPPFLFGGKIMFLGNGGFVRGIRTDGAGWKTDPNRNLLSMPFNGMGTDYKLDINEKSDSVFIDLDLTINEEWATAEVDMSFSLSHSGGNLSEKYRIYYDQQHDGGAAGSLTSFVIDTLYDNNNSIFVDSIYIAAASADNIRFIITMDSTAATTRYFTGQVKFGGNVSNATAKIRGLYE